MLCVTNITHADSSDQLFKLAPDDGAVYDLFGASVAIDGETAVVGAYGDDDSGARSGSTYLFDATTGDQIFKLTPDDGAVEDRFGDSVAIDGDTVLVGVPYDDDNGSGSGSVYQFDVTTGGQLAKLTPDDGAWGDRFGVSVAIDGDIALIGAEHGRNNRVDSGSAYLFDITTGEQIAKLTASDGRGNDRFGSSVAIAGDIALIGAYGDDDSGPLSGSAYLFDVTTGVQLAKLTPDDGAEDDWFGSSVAIAGDTALVGAYGDGDNGSFSGSVYLFDVTTGDLLFKLTPDDGAAGNNFGRSVSIAGDMALVGASRDDDNGFRSGSAYLFEVSTGKQLAKLTPDDGMADDWFGSSVAIADGIALVGAILDDDNGSSSGSAYLFSTVPEPSTALLAAFASLASVVNRRRAR